MNKINVFYVGLKGNNFTKIDDFLHGYHTGLFNLVQHESIEEVAEKVLSFKDFVIIDLSLKLEKSILKLREVHEEIKRIGATSICLTNALDHNTIANIAEIGFDGVLVKPFNFRTFKNVIDNIKLFSFETNDYFLTIEKGKKALFQEMNFTKSYHIFRKATSYHTTPSLAYFYLGKTCEYMNRDVNAINYYRRGLRLNKWHFNSLSSLLDTYIRHKDSDEAFTLLKYITRTYPESPERFCLAIKLAIKDFRFDEILELATVYEAINQRTPTVDKYFFSALYVSTKYYLNKGEMGQANAIAKQLLRFSHKTNFYKGLIREAYQKHSKELEFQKLDLNAA